MSIFIIYSELQNYKKSLFYSTILAANAVTTFRGLSLVVKVRKRFFAPWIAVVFPFIIALYVNSANSLEVGALLNIAGSPMSATCANSDWVAPGQIAVTFTFCFFSSHDRKRDFSNSCGSYLSGFSFRNGSVYQYYF